MDTDTPSYVKAIREGMKQTQREFAENFGLSIRTIQDWEIGRREPGPAAQIILGQLIRRKR